MKRMMTWMGLFFFILGFGTTAAFGETVTLGVVGPLTGPVAVGGIQTKYGLELAKDEINAKGGIPGVGEIELIYEDDKCIPPESGNAVNKLVYRDKVLAVIGSVCSSATMAGMIVSQKAKTPQITAISTSPAITQKGNEWIFRTSIADATRAGALAEFAVKELKKTKVGIIHDADDYGRDGAYAFADKLKEFNIEPKVIESFNRKDKDFSGQLSKMAKEGVEVLVIWGLPEESALIAKQVKAMNLDVQIMGGDPIANSRFIELAGPAAEGAMTGIGFVPTDPDTNIQAFISEIQKRYKTAVTNVVANSYDCLYILAKAIEQSGTDKAKLRDALSGIRYEGITGVTTFDKNGGSLRQPTIVVVKNGKVLKYE